MTYLQLVNSVLRRLREDEVTTVSANSYSKLVGEYVNDAKRTVEDAWDWTALRDTLTVTTQADVFNYILVGSQNRMKILDVINDTSNFFVQYQTSRWFDRAYLTQGSVPVGTPQYYSFNGVSASGDNGVDLYPKPDAAYTVRFNVVLRTDEFPTDATNMLIPSAPVVQLATALAARERGETGGTSAAEMFAFADSTLADAIAMDASQHPEETIWYS
jgi:hypothetical protein|tara:strand:- start:2112 stop:2759 length:648 start_codon:yes stop_codon:yes gene_type:complete